MDLDGRLNRILIDCLADAIVARLRARARRALVIDSDGAAGGEVVAAQMHTLRAAGWTLVPADDGSARLSDVALVLVPTLGVSLAAKVALGIADDPASDLLAAALQRGRRVVAARDGACPVARGDRPSAAYAAMMRAHLTTLASYGVEVCAASRLADTVLAAPKPQATAAASPASASVFGWSAARAWRGPQLTLDRTVLVTPLAAEELSARGIRLLRE